MPSSDISKCYRNYDCPKREKCWRNVMPDHELQSYTTFNTDGGECEWFIPTPDEEGA